jgi:hypothetical protein
MLAEATVEQSKVGLRGPLIRQSDAEYAEARKAYNAMIYKHPRMIVRCARRLALKMCPYGDLGSGSSQLV